MQNRNISDIIEQYLKSILKESPSIEIKRSEIAQLGRAPRSGRGGRRFKSCFPDLNKTVCNNDCCDSVQDAKII